MPTLENANITVVRRNKRDSIGIVQDGLAVTGSYNFRAPSFADVVEQPRGTPSVSPNPKGRRWDNGSDLTRSADAVSVAQCSSFAAYAEGTRGPIADVRLPAGNSVLSAAPPTLSAPPLAQPHMGRTLSPPPGLGSFLQTVLAQQMVVGSYPRPMPPPSVLGAGVPMTPNSRSLQHGCV